MAQLPCWSAPSGSMGTQHYGSACPATVSVSRVKAQRRCARRVIRCPTECLAPGLVCVHPGTCPLCQSRSLPQALLRCVRPPSPLCTHAKKPHGGVLGRLGVVMLVWLVCPLPRVHMARAGPLCTTLTHIHAAFSLVAALFRMLDPNDGTPCLACHRTCASCTGTSWNQCASCNPAHNRVLNGTWCACAPGFYDDSVDSVCQGTRLCRVTVTQHAVHTSHHVVPGGLSLPAAA